MTTQQRLLRCTLCVHDIVSIPSKLYHRSLKNSHAPLEQHIILGTLRHYLGLEKLLDQHCCIQSKDRILISLMVCVLYQLHHMDKAPPKQLIYDAAALCPRLKKSSAKALVYAVLKKLAPPFTLNIRPQDNLPQWLQEKLDAYGSKNSQRWAQLWLQPNSLQWCRMKVDNTDRPSTHQLLQEAAIPTSASPLLPSAIAIPSQAVKKLDTALRDRLYLQNITNQRIIHSLPQLPAKAHILDCCAAPGGKAQDLLQRYPQARLVANDIAHEKLITLQQNLSPWQDRLTLTQHNFEQAPPSQHWAQQSFDFILVDAPCSATGTLQRKPDVKFSHSALNISKLQEKQHLILTHVWPLLKPGGYLCYATCSILPEENGDTIRKFMAQSLDCKRLAFEPLEDQHDHQGVVFLPHHNHDGGFMAVLEKTVDNPRTTPS